MLREALLRNAPQHEAGRTCGCRPAAPHTRSNDVPIRINRRPAAETRAGKYYEMRCTAGALRQSECLFMRTAYRSVAASLAALGLFLLAITVTPPASAREVVAFDADVSPGTIIVRTSERRLYYVLGRGQAIRYPVGVGRVGRQWAGRTMVNGKYLRPDWSPPLDIARAQPNLPRIIPGGAPNNPMGVAALTLSGGEYAIHGTNQ